MDKLACADSLEFGICQERFGRISWSKNSFDYLDVKLKVFKKDENKKFRLAQNLARWETDFNQFIRLTNQLVVAVRDFSKEENLPPVKVKLLAKAWSSTLNLHTICRNCWWTTQKDLCDYAALQSGEAGDAICSSAIDWKKKGGRKTIQIVYVIYKPDEFISSLVVMYSVYDKIFASDLLCNAL